MALEIRLTRDLTDLDQIYQLRFRVYYEELGSRLPFNVIITKKLHDSIDEVAYHYAAFENGQVIGCLRAYDLKDAFDRSQLITRYQLNPAVSALGESVIGFTGRVVLDPKVRKISWASHQLFSAAADDGRQRGIRACFFDCSPHLLAMYEGYGCKRYAQPFSDPVFGFKQPLVLCLRDLLGLREIGSPLAIASHPFEDDPGIREWYAGHYCEYGIPLSATLVPILEFIRTVEDFAGKTIDRLSLFKGLSSAKIEGVLKRSTIVKAQKGDIVIRQGLQEEFLIVVLSGELHCKTGKVTIPLKATELYGSVEFLTGASRICDVICVEDSHLLIVPTKHLSNRIRKDGATGKILTETLTVSRSKIAALQTEPESSCF